MAQVNASGKRDISLWRLGMADHDQFLMMRSADAYALIQQHLAAGRFDGFAEVLVLLLAVLKLVQMGPPHQPLHHHAPFCGVTEQLADRGSAIAHQFVGIAAPVGKEDVVARAQCLYFGDESLEIRGTVNERLGAVAFRPRWYSGGR